MPDLDLTTSYHVVLLLLAAVAAGLLAVFVYRFTVPPVSRGVRGTLMGVRGLGLFLLFLLIGEPLLSLVSHRTERPVLAVLIDQSRSMTIRDKSGDRKETLLTTLTSPDLRKVDGNSELLYGVFDTKLHLLQSFAKDSVSFTGEGTDIGGALKQLREQTSERNIQGVLIISDGNSTGGSSPLFEAEESGLPVFTVGIGDTSEPHDVMVQKALANNITYVGNKVPVNATLKSSGMNNERVEVTLLEGGKTLDRKTIQLEPGTREYDVPLSFVPDLDGTKKITVEVSQLPGEVSAQNNRSSFYMKVLKSKMRVVLIAGAPSADVAAIRRALQDDPNIEVKTFIERGNGQFYEGVLSDQDVRPAECVVLVGYPGPQSSVSAIQTVATAAGSGKGMLFVLSRTTDLRKLQMLQSVLPFNIPARPGEETQTFLAAAENQRNNPILRVSSSLDVWGKLPPSFTMDEPFRSKPEGVVLATVRVQSSPGTEPLMISRNVNRSKSLAILCYGLWRWKSYSDGIPGAERILENLFSNSVRWLVTRDDEKPVQIRPSKEMFAGSEPVEFTAQVYDETYRPLGDAEVSLSVSQKGQASQLTLSSLGNGRFEGAFDPLPEGDYTYTARATEGGRQLGEERGSFSVGGLNVEFQETRANKLLLQQISARTGGRYFESGDLGQLAEDLTSLRNFRPKDVTAARQFELWNRTWMLGAVVALFAVEWFLRKKHGML
ncbi:MAG: VWA domain-containing protein [Ignavibacteriales bacterium]|nr:VWA domain-containing protein [Ignavibacteriales bacterium]